MKENRTYQMDIPPYNKNYIPNNHLMMKRMKFLMNRLEHKLIYLKEVSKISNKEYNKKIM